MRHSVTSITRGSDAWYIVTRPWPTRSSSLRSRVHRRRAVSEVTSSSAPWPTRSARGDFLGHRLPRRRRRPRRAVLPPRRPRWHDRRGRCNVGPRLSRRRSRRRFAPAGPSPRGRTPRGRAVPRVIVASADMPSARRSWRCRIGASRPCDEPTGPAAPDAGTSQRSNRPFRVRRRPRPLDTQHPRGPCRRRERLRQCLPPSRRPRQTRARARPTSRPSPQPTAPRALPRLCATVETQLAVAPGGWDLLGRANARRRLVDAGEGEVGPSRAGADPDADQHAGDAASAQTATMTTTAGSVRSRRRGASRRPQAAQREPRAVEELEAWSSRPTPRPTRLAPGGAQSRGRQGQSGEGARRPQGRARVAVRGRGSQAEAVMRRLRPRPQAAAACAKSMLEIVGQIPKAAASRGLQAAGDEITASRRIQGLVASAGG